VIRVLLTVGGANPANGITSFFRPGPIRWRGASRIVHASDAKLRVLVNYGIAALFWLIVSSILARIVRRLG